MSMNNTPKVIATIKPFYSSTYKFDLIDELICCGIHEFRFNISKFSEDIQILNFLDYLAHMRKHFGDQIYINLDMPLPGQKPRIFFNQGKVSVNNFDEIIINSNKYNINTSDFYINVENIGTRMKVGQTVLYSDGEGQFIVSKVLDLNRVVLKSLNNMVLFSGKALTFNYVNYNNFVNDKIVHKINDLNPDSISFSFINSRDAILLLKNTFSCNNIEYISKIETMSAVENIKEIALESNIMIGRGDLFNNIDFCDLYNIQKRIAYITHRSMRKLYIATGILNSLSRNIMPSQADIIDLSSIIILNPDAIIINYDLIKEGRIKQVIEIINDVSQNIMKYMEGGNNLL